MSVYLQFDSSARSNPYIKRDLGAGVVFVPNDNYPNNPAPASPEAYQLNKNLVQTPTNYRVFYRELNDANNVRTIGFLAHCKERPTNLNFSVESCVVVVPSNGLVPRVDNTGAITFVSILDEPYLYVRMLPINHAEGNLIYSNNPGADDATFIVWCDKIQGGTDGSPPITEIDRPNPCLPISEINTARWVIYKSCMITVMRLDLEAEEWQIRIYDRFGNDVILGESDNGGAGFNQQEPPPIDPNLQTMLLVGIKPNYPL
uniref:Uncharacterized protein n=2 Tax=root TaxID=1 RepID=A0A481YXX6_9VIRU|nr:MAG: hypothetical protein LCMAC202_00430 [Marseillevirus LCMAC202]